MLPDPSATVQLPTCARPIDISPSFKRVIVFPLPAPMYPAVQSWSLSEDEGEDSEDEDGPLVELTDFVGTNGVTGVCDAAFVQHRDDLVAALVQAAVNQAVHSFNETDLAARGLLTIPTRWPPPRRQIVQRKKAKLAGEHDGKAKSRTISCRAVLGYAPKAMQKLIRRETGNSRLAGEDGRCTFRKVSCATIMLGAMLIILPLHRPTVRAHL